eukprot:4657116-Alexandrium_andersonii.AAC.1
MVQVAQESSQKGAGQATYLQSALAGGHLDGEGGEPPTNEASAAQHSGAQAVMSVDVQPSDLAGCQKEELHKQ